MGRSPNNWDFQWLGGWPYIQGTANDADTTNPKETTMNKFTTALFAVVLSAGAVVSTASLAHASYGDGYERWVDIVNLSGMEIWSVQISNIDNPTWPRFDLLRGDVIDGYDQARVEPPHPQGYCRFDALITYADGTEVPVWDVNLCEATTIEVDDDGYADVA